VKSETRPSESERAVRVAENVPCPWESGSVGAWQRVREKSGVLGGSLVASKVEQNGKECAWQRFEKHGVYLLLSMSMCVERAG